MLLTGNQQLFLGSSSAMASQGVLPCAANGLFGSAWAPAGQLSSSEPLPFTTHAFDSLRLRLGADSFTNSQVFGGHGLGGTAFSSVPLLFGSAPLAPLSAPMPSLFQQPEAAMPALPGPYGVPQHPVSPQHMGLGGFAAAPKPASPHMPPLSELRSIFFAGVTPIIQTETLMALFSQFGIVVDLNLFKPWSGSKTSKGCGLVVYADHPSAAAALDTLSGQFQWPGARGPMIVEWMDPNKQHKKARATCLHAAAPMPPAMPRHHQHHQQQQQQQMLQQPQQHSPPHQFLMHAGLLPGQLGMMAAQLMA